jgi:glucosamine--fructose-6-phosphate aminotransferase (isomerizing)
MTIALTGVRESPLVQSADHAIIQNEHELRPRPASVASSGVFALGNYLASMLALFDLAFRIGISRGTLSLDVRQKLLGEIKRASDITTMTVAAVRDAVREFAASVSEAPAYYILGGGPSYATALFAAAKLFEMPQAQGVPVELEEWAHEQYFLTRPGSVCLVVAPPAASLDRATEQIEGAKEMGARVAIICDRKDTTTGPGADVRFQVAGELPEEFSPLTYCVPLELFAIYLCQALDRPAFGFISQTQFDVNMRQIGKSRIRD